MAMRFKSLSPLPRNIRRSNLKKAIKAGKPAYDTGVKDGYQQGYKAGHEAALNELAAELQQYRDQPAAQTPAELAKEA